MKMFWILIITSFILSLLFAIKELSIFFLVSILNLLAIILLYKEVKRDDTIKKIEKKIDNIDVDKIIKKLDNLRDDQTNYLTKAFEVEMDLAKYKEEQEEKYREIVKKVLELDNKLTEKYELLGKSILKLSKDIKKG
ncbi:MAG: hypothetical protein KQA41_00895 [Candidatus Aenigmarchaeota archaeon]|nr:hypothetical protein [Candidatus Aenigmarchaeota archaeon]